jgi:Signal transduction histidine kinase
MLFSVGLSALLPLAALITVSASFAYRTASQDAYRYAEALGEHYASTLASRLSSFSGSLSALASTCSSYEMIPPEHRRTIISAQLRAALVGNPELLAAWAQWEGGAIGDDPSAFAGSALSTPSGAFNTTWYRQSDRIMQGSIGDADYARDFYTIPKSTLALSLIDPYRYSYAGPGEGSVLETSLCCPIIVDGAFKGVVGFDFPIALFADIASRISVFDSGYGFIVNGEGKIVAHRSPDLIDHVVGDDLPAEDARALVARLGAGAAFSLAKRSVAIGAESRFFFCPIEVSGLPRPWFFVLVAPVSAILAPARGLALLLGLVGLLGASVVAIAIFLASRAITRPISALADGARRVASGERGFRLELSRNDELGELASSFDAMSAELERSLCGLEERVSERTASLERAHQELEVAEKMAFVGRLSASIAHELNTPLGAIRSSSSFILSSLQEYLERFLELYAELSESDRILFLDLLMHGSERALRVDDASDRKRMQELARRAEAAGIERPRAFAESVAALDAFGREADLLDRSRLNAAELVRVANRATELFRAAAISLSASEKAASTVGALSTYSQGAVLDTLEEIDPTEDIEAVLALYQGKIKRNVKVERSYGERGIVFGYRARLKEVWANLIDNALEAMDYKGTLGLATACEAGELVVSVSDTGTGIPKEYYDKIFTPFFTTKAPGEGTGLGLDICRRIIDRHGGAISFASGPQGSTFSVRLKLAVRKVV